MKVLGWPEGQASPIGRIITIAGLFGARTYEITDAVQVEPETLDLRLVEVPSEDAQTTIERLPRTAMTAPELPAGLRPVVKKPSRVPGRGQNRVAAIVIGIALVVAVVVGGPTLLANIHNATSGPAGAAGASVAGQTLLTFSGNGPKTSATFDAPGDWQIDYSYDCSKFSNGQGVFQIYVYQNDLPSGGGANLLGPGGQDTTYEHFGGPTYLMVNSECSWSLTART